MLSSTWSKNVNFPSWGGCHEDKELAGSVGSFQDAYFPVYCLFFILCGPHNLVLFASLYIVSK